MTTVCRPLANTGSALCPFLMKVSRRVVLVPKIGSDGTVNKIDSADDLTLSFLEEKMNAEDPMDRYYVLPLIENVENVRAETVFFEWNSGQKVRIRQGARTFSCALPNDNTDTSLLKRLQNWYGQSFGVFLIDQAGNWIYDQGNDEADEALYPIAVDGNSFDVNLVTETYAEPLYTMLQFDFASDNNDGNLLYVGYQSLDFDAKSSELYGLWDLTITGTASTSEVLFDVVTNYEVPVSGLLDTDITLLNVTTELALTVDTLVESVATPGSYTATFTGTVSASDIVRLTISKSRYATTDLDIVAS